MTRFPWSKLVGSQKVGDGKKEVHVHHHYHYYEEDIIKMMDDPKLIHQYNHKMGEK